MSVVVKRSLAFKDLAEIWSFIADDSEANADQFLATLDDKLKVLATQPRMGRLRDELIPELRSFPYGRYVVLPIVGQFAQQGRLFPGQAVMLIEPPKCRVFLTRFRVNQHDIAMI